MIKVKKCIKLIMVVFVLMIVITNNTTMKVKSENPNKAVLFERVGRYYFTYNSGYNSRNQNTHKIPVSKANEYVNIPELASQDSSIFNSSADTLVFEYANTTVKQAYLTVAHNDVLSVNEPFEPILLKLNPDLTIANRINLSNGLEIVGTKLNACGLDYRSRKVRYNVTDFVSANGAGIYAVANIPREFRVGLGCGANPTWSMNTVLESPVLPLSYSILVDSPIIANTGTDATRTNGGSRNSDSYTIESELFQTPTSGEIKATLLMVGRNQVYGSKQLLNETVTISQRNKQEQSQMIIMLAPPIPMIMFLMAFEIVPEMMLKSLAGHIRRILRVTWILEEQ